MTDGTKGCFVIRSESGYSHEAFSKLNADQLDRLIQLIIQLKLTALTSANLVNDFCHPPKNNGIAFNLVKSLYSTLLHNITPKTQMLFDEWKELFNLSHDDVSQQQASAKLLGLEEVIIKKVWEEETKKHIEIELPRRLHVCPDCGAETGKIHDYRMQSVKDTASSPAWRKNLSKSGTFFQSPRLKLIKQKAKESIPWTISDLIPPPCSLSAC